MENRNKKVHTSQPGNVLVYVGVFLFAAAGVFLSFFLYQKENAEQQRYFELLLEENSEERIQAISLELKQDISVAHVLASFFESSKEVSRKEFQSFTKYFIDSRRSIQALEWIPRVIDSERVAFEKKIQEQFPGFQITERNAQGKMVRAAKRAEYYPVFFIEPLQGNEEALGFDLASNPARLETLQESADTGRTLATGNITLVQETENQPGFLLFHPIYDTHESVVPHYARDTRQTVSFSVEERREQLAGFVLGVFRTGEFFSQVLKDYPAVGLDIHLFDLTASIGEQYIFSSSDNKDDKIFSKEIDRSVLKEKLHFAEEIEVGGRHWEIICTPNAFFYKTVSVSHHAKGYLAAGLLITFLAAVIFVTFMNRTRRVQELVNKRTAELNKALVNTETARVELAESKENLQVSNKVSGVFLTFSGDELYAEILDVVLDVMNSKFGFFGYINEDGSMVSPSMTRNIMGKCQIPDKNIIFERSAWAGIWGDTLKKNKTYVKNSDLIVPDGHIALDRALSVPIMHKSDRIGIIAVANKASDYSKTDIKTLEIISDQIAPILSVRLQRDAQEKARQIAERELELSLEDTEQARDRIDGILKSVADGLIVTDIHNRVVLMNPAAEELLSVRLSGVIERPIGFAIKDDVLRKKVEETLDLKTTGYSFDFELSKSGEEENLVMRARTSVIFDQEGNNSGIVTIISDVTHEREVDRMKTEFISTAAHELRTPLTSIRGFSEILITRDDLKAEERKKFLGYINEQSEKLSSIINDLLDITRLESGRGFTLNKVACDAGQAMQQVLPYFESISSGHTFELIGPEKPTSMTVDKEKMEQVLKNLLSNAVKYSPDGGRIRLEGKFVDDYFMVSVSDEGMGMAPEQLEKIFDKFYRVDSTDTAIEGTGLGMTIVKYIVEAHNGKIWVESEPGKGTTVTFTLPVD